MKDPRIQHGKEYKALRRQGLSEEIAEKIVMASDNELKDDKNSNLESLDYNQLMELARIRRIKGIDKMNQQQVIEALRKQKNV